MTIHDMIQHSELRQAIIQHCRDIKVALGLFAEGRTEMAIQRLEVAVDVLQEITERHATEDGMKVEEGDG